MPGASAALAPSAQAERRGAVESMKASRPGAGQKFADLRLRLISALVLAVLALGCIWAGGVWTALLAALGGFIMMQEWRSISAEAGGPAGLPLAPYAVGVVGAVLLLRIVPGWAAVLFLAVCASAGLALAGRRGPLQARLW